MSAPHDLDRRLDDWLAGRSVPCTRALDRGRPRPRRHASAAARSAGGPAARPDGLGRARHGRAALGAAGGGAGAAARGGAGRGHGRRPVPAATRRSCRRCRRSRRPHPWRRRRRPPRPARRARSRAPRPRPSGWTSSTTSVAMPTSRSRTSPGRSSGRVGSVVRSRSGHRRHRREQPRRRSARRSSCPGSAARRTRATS